MGSGFGANWAKIDAYRRQEGIIMSCDKLIDIRDIIRSVVYYEKNLSKFNAHGPIPRLDYFMLSVDSAIKHEVSSGCENRLQQTIRLVQQILYYHSIGGIVFRCPLSLEVLKRVIEC